jgi:hypothetical protein
MKKGESFINARVLKEAQAIQSLGKLGLPLPEIPQRARAAFEALYAQEVQHYEALLCLTEALLDYAERLTQTTPAHIEKVQAHPLLTEGDLTEMKAIHGLYLFPSRTHVTMCYDGHDLRYIALKTPKKE